MLGAALTHGAGPAAAHDSVVTTSPADGAKMAKAPAEIVLTLSESPLRGTAKVTATAPSGTTFALPDPVYGRGSAGPTLTTPWPQDRPAGRYTVNWRVVSADGHPIGGTFAFTYTVDASIAPPASGPASPTGSATTSASPSASPAQSSGRSGSSWVWVISTIAGLGVILVSLILMARWRKREESR